jgi:disease resistance protein RPS2
MIASLIQLKILEISYCEELEQIIAKDNDDEKDQILSGSDLQSSRFPNLCRLEITRCNKLKSLFPSNLTTLKVKECKSLTHVFTDSMIASLLQLEFLEISACEELEQIIAKDNDDEKDQILSGSDLQSSCFPNLCRLEITRCNKLKSLFPIAMASGLKKLRELKVRKSSQLLGVFGQDDHASPANIEKEMVLPDLHELYLEQLPSISCFSLGCYDFLFPHLETLQVHGCPKLTTIFGTTSNGSMSAQSEVLYI